MNNVNGESMEDLHQRTLDKQEYLQREGYRYVCKWECDFDREIKENPLVKEFMESIEMVTPLEPRDAFYGGRTEAFTLYQEAGEQQIDYYDVTSLYPFVNKTGKIPLGHPTIITENFKNVESYEGLIKCKILPPRGLYVPVLPSKINGKLMFPLCRTCTETYQQTTCYHSDEERSLTGTWVTDELKKALEKGYKMMKIYEVWHFDKTEQYDPTTKTGGLFTEYVNTFLRMKQEASGWPQWCETEEDKRKYIDDYYNKEGIRLEYSKVQKNPGLRALAKLMLNR